MPTLTCPLATALTPLHLGPRTPRPARRMGWVAATPAVRAGFDGPSFTLPAPQVPRRAGESTVLARTPLTRRSCQGSVLRHPAPSNTPRRGEGGCSIGGGPIMTKLALRQDSPVADLSEGFGWRPSRRANARSLSPFRWLRKCRESLPPRARPHTDRRAGRTLPCADPTVWRANSLSLITSKRKCA